MFSFKRPLANAKIYGGFSEGESLLRFQIVLARCMAFYRWLKESTDGKAKKRSKNYFLKKRDVILRKLPEIFSGSSGTVGCKVFMPRALTNLKGAFT